MKQYRVKVWLSSKFAASDFEFVLTNGDYKLISEGGVLCVHNERGFLVAAYAPHAWSHVEVEEISE